MLVGLICHFFSPVTHSMSVDLFQHFIRTPSTIRHDVGIWDTECVPDRSGVVAEIMKTEMRYIIPIQYPLKHNSDGMWIQ